jgi:hypothetical protein
MKRTWVDWTLLALLLAMTAMLVIGVAKKVSAHFVTRQCLAIRFQRQ